MTLNNGTDDTSLHSKHLKKQKQCLKKQTRNAIRQEKFIRDLKNALFRVENRTYGLCK
jgi:RNA polymerase-binding transcription factor DksA